MLHQLSSQQQAFQRLRGDFASDGAQAASLRYRQHRRVSDLWVFRAVGQRPQHRELRVLGR